ncbi:MAG: helix-turn-helix domain-containing protein [Planctomycetota bacterium]|jgi:excisionase family DNA binding protein
MLVDDHSLDMLTTGEVARIINININTIRSWSNQGIIRAYRVGKRGDRRFRKEDVINLLGKPRVVNARHLQD